MSFAPVEFSFPLCKPFFFCRVSSVFLCSPRPVVFPSPDPFRCPSKPCCSRQGWKRAVMLAWVLRCAPVLSSVLLLLITYSAFQEPSDSSPSFYTTPRCYTRDCWKPLSLSQFIYLAYTLLMHLQLLIYGPQICISLHWLTRNIKAIRDCRVARNLIVNQTKTSDVDLYTDSGYTSDDSLTSASDVAITLPDQPTSEDNVVHAIILPNYMEELDTLRETLSVLASHARALQQYEVCCSRNGKGFPTLAPQGPFSFYLRQSHPCNY